MLAVADKVQVRAFHAKALSLKANDDGAPGLRTDRFDAGRFRELDGNELRVFYMACWHRNGQVPRKCCCAWAAFSTMCGATPRSFKASPSFMRRKLLVV